MIEVLEFIFQDSWHWLGTAILIAIIFRVNLVKICLLYTSDAADE